MEFEKMTSLHIEEASELNFRQYLEECQLCSSVPRKNFRNVIKNQLLELVEKNLGVVAISNGLVVGYLVGYGPIENFFGKNKGIYIPLEGSGASEKDRGRIYSRLYAYGSNLWVEKEIVSHSITLYAHDNESVNSFFVNGFGMRCVDAMSFVEVELLPDFYRKAQGDFEKLKKDNEVSIHENPHKKEDLEDIYEMKIRLIQHLNQSPTFLSKAIPSFSDFYKTMNKENAKVIYLKKRDDIIGFLEYKSDGENFISWDKDVINICGAYLKPMYRGSGLSDYLLYYAFRRFEEKGYKSCGVDFESINPEANGFWSKHFAAYTKSLHRRVDENVLDNMSGN